MSDRSTYKNWIDGLETIEDCINKVALEYRSREISKHKSGIMENAQYVEKEDKNTKVDMNK